MVAAESSLATRYARRYATLTLNAFPRAAERNEAARECQVRRRRDNVEKASGRRRLLK